MNAAKHVLLLMLSASALVKAQADETNYFLVAEPPGRVVHHDSYVLPLSKPDDIAHARYLISLGPSVFLGSHSALVVAKGAIGQDGINRNFLDSRLPEWFWHVDEFLAFADVTAEVLDGGPSLLDAGWPIIGFWNYTVVRELGPRPLFMSTVPDSQCLQLYWSGMGTNYVYTLESTDSATSTNWIAVPGAAWPLNTNHWTLPLTNKSPLQYFRVRAEQAN